MDRRAVTGSNGRFSNSRQEVVVDQIVSSGTNFMWFVAAGAATTSDGFGGFAIASSLFAVALGAARATSSERLGASGSDRHHGVVTQSTLWIILALGIGSVIVYWAYPSPATAFWIVAGPLVLIQDRMRYVAYVFRPVVSLVSDLAWLLAVLVSWIGALAWGDMPAVWLGLSLVVGPAVGLVIAFVGCHGALIWRVDRDSAMVRSELPFVIDGWLLAATVFAVLAFIGAVGSLTQAGSVRVLLLLFHPFFSLGYIGRWFTITDDRELGRRRWPRQLTLAAAAYVVVLTCGLIAVRPIWSGSGFGGVWSASYWLVALSQVARAFHQGVSDVARRTTSDGLVRARIAFGFATCAAVVVLASAGGLLSWAIALFVGFLSGALVATRAGAIN
jgi:hypothetical protein